VNFGAWNFSSSQRRHAGVWQSGATADKLTVQGWLYDVKNTASPQVLGKQYSDAANEACGPAHRPQNLPTRFILRLGGGIPGIAESQPGTYL